MFSYPRSTQINNNKNTLTNDSKPSSTNSLSSEISQMIRNNHHNVKPRTCVSDLHQSSRGISVETQDTLKYRSDGEFPCVSDEEYVGTMNQNMASNFYNSNYSFDYFDAWRPVSNIEDIGSFSEQNAVISFLKKRESVPDDHDIFEYNSFQEDPMLDVETRKLTEVFEVKQTQEQFQNTVSKDGSGRQFLSFSNGSEYSFYGSNNEENSENSITPDRSENNEEIINTRTESVRENILPVSSSPISDDENVSLYSSNHKVRICHESKIDTTRTASFLTVPQLSENNKARMPPVLTHRRPRENVQVVGPSNISEHSDNSLTYKNYSAINNEVAEERYQAPVIFVKNKVHSMNSNFQELAEHGLNSIRHPNSELVSVPCALHNNPLQLKFQPLRTEKNPNFTEYHVEKINGNIINSFCIRNLSSSLYVSFHDLSDSPFSYIQKPLEYYSAPKPVESPAADWSPILNNFKSLVIKDPCTIEAKNTANKSFKNQSNLSGKRKYKNFAQKSRHLKMKATLPGCKFCRSNCETKEIYSNHELKQRVGNKTVVSCPVLRRLVCERCGSSGDDAHTLSYCPLVIAEKGEKPISVANELKKTKRFASGKVRRGQQF